MQKAGAEETITRGDLFETCLKLKRLQHIIFFVKSNSPDFFLEKTGIMKIPTASSQNT